MTYLNRISKNVGCFIEKYGKYLFIAIIFIAIIFVGREYLYYKEIRDNKKDTLGVIVSYDRSTRGDGNLTYYKYVVNNKAYTGKVSLNNFRGSNGGFICLGCTFKVYYSSKDPNKSRLFLGEYEKYKRTIEFGLFDD